MSSTPTLSPIAVRTVRILLLLTGTFLIGYAISDHPLYGGEPGFGSTQVVISAAGAVIALCALFPVSIGSRMLLLMLTFLIMLAFAEFAGNIVLGARYRPNFQYDDRLIFKLIPNSTRTITGSKINGGVTVTHHINSEGFRGEELLPPGKSARITVYGDSFIHAYYSPQEETFVGQLKAQLEQRTGRKFEVVNSGVSSYGPDQESRKMEDELPRLRPNLMIVAIFAGNDYGDLMRNKMFRLGANGELVVNRWKLDPSVQTLFEISQRESIIKRALRSIFESMQVQSQSKFTNFDFLLGEAEREYRSFIVEKNDVITNTHTDYYSADVSLIPRSDSARYKVALMGAVMQRIRDIAQRNSTPLVFLFIPHPVDVTERYDNWVVDRKRFPDYDGRNQTAPLEEAAIKLGVSYVSLYDAFRKADANLLYFHEDDHWNGTGQRFAAEMMAGYLLASSDFRKSLLLDQ